ncbi:MAG: ribulose-phosphate 3-epimerase [Anaerolineae bacterium]
MVEIAPSILSADFARLGEEVQACERAGADRIHIDVMDGCFVPNITVGPVVVSAVRRATSLPLDVHLMVVEPERHLEAFARAGATTLLVQVEAAVHLHRAVQRIRGLGLRAGVVLNPATPLCFLDEILPEVDQVLLMTVNPGFGGQSFIPSTLDKIRRLAQRLREGGFSVDLEVDGGITPETALQVVRAGANVLVAGSAVFEAKEGVAAAIARLRQAAEAVEAQKGQ